MRHTLTLTSLVLVLVAVIVTAPINAQVPFVPVPLCADGNPAYIVRDGDTVWAKGGPAWNAGWASLVAQNPWLVNRRTDVSLDKVFVLLKVGEPICGLKESGLNVGSESEMASPAALKNNEPAAASPHEMGHNPPVPHAVGDQSNNYKGALVLLVVLLVGFGVIAIFAKRRTQQARQEDKRDILTKIYNVPFEVRDMLKNAASAPQPQPTFGLNEARERAALGGSYVELRLYALQLEHLGVRNILAEEVASERRKHLDEMNRLNGLATARARKISELQGQIAELGLQIRADEQLIAESWTAAKELKQFAERFITSPPDVDKAQTPLPQLSVKDATTVNAGGDSAK